MSHRTWRIFHGILSIVFIGFASWHAINLGRHTNKGLSFYILILSCSGVMLLLNTYFSKSSKKPEENKCLKINEINGISRRKFMALAGGAAGLAALASMGINANWGEIEPILRSMN